MVGVTKAVGSRFGKGGIADRMIWFNGFPFLDNKEEHTFGVPVSHVMTTETTVLPVSGLDLKTVEKLLERNKYQGFPIVEDRQTSVLVGYIGRTELRYAIDRAKREQAVSPMARCFFGSTDSSTRVTPTASTPAVTFDTLPSTSNQMSIDFSRFVNITPLAVHPRLPLETVMELFKKMGPRVILVEYHGQLAGLVTVKDCLKYQFKVEASGNSKDESAVEERQEKLWALIQSVGRWLADRTYRVSIGRVRLGDSPLIGRFMDSPSSPHHILDGTEDGEDGVELDNR